MFWTSTGNVAVWRRFRRDAPEVAIGHGWKPQPRWRQPHLAGGEVLVSRGELVEIGGSFRMPDIIGPSGARLVEVGTTNETRRADYARAITSHARLLLKVHPSNYRIEGFTAAVTTADLAALGRDRDIQVVEDLGSGALVDLQRFGLPFEPTVTATLAAGADLVTCSGDKLLGGPQAGLILGRKVLVERMAKHPLLRAVRSDKLTLAALEATLQLYLDAERLPERLPVLPMLTRPENELKERSERLMALLRELAGIAVDCRPGTTYAGGGSLAGAELSTWLVRLAPKRLAVDALAARLRAHRPAIIGGIKDNRLLLDMRTVADGELPEIAAALRQVLV